MNPYVRLVFALVFLVQTVKQTTFLPGWRQKQAVKAALLDGSVILPGCILLLLFPWLRRGVCDGL